MQNDLRKERILYFDALRVIACLAVIVLNLTSRWFNILSLETQSWMALNIFNGTANIAVPIFVMISGALFLDPERRPDLPGLLKKNVLHIAVTFVFWSALYSLVDYWQGVRMRDVAFNFISGHSHLWFLYMIAGLYLVIPLLRKITESRRLTVYFLVLWFVFSVLTTTAEACVSYFRSYFPHWIDVIQEAANVNLVTGYVGYFVLGHFLHHRDFTKKERGILCGLGVVGAALTVLFTYMFSRKTSALDLSFYNTMSLGVLLEAAAVFVLFKYHTPQTGNLRLRKLLETAAVCSFGVYLSHMLVIRIAPTLFPFSEVKIPLAFSIPLYALGIFLLSFLVTFILKKIPFINRYIV